MEVETGERNVSVSSIFCSFMSALPPSPQSSLSLSYPLTSQFSTEEKGDDAPKDEERKGEEPSVSVSGKGSGELGGVGQVRCSLASQFFLVRGEEKKKRLETLARFSWAVGMQLPEFPPPFCDVC